MKKTPAITVFIENTYLITPEFLTKLSRYGSVRQRMTHDKNELCRILDETDIAVTGWDSPLLPVEAIKKNMRLKYICNMTGELKRWVPFEFIKTIKVTNWGTIIAFETAEGTIALMLSVLKQIPALHAACTEKGRALNVLARRLLSLRGIRIGIYGLGPVGSETARMLKVFGPKLSFYDPTIKKTPSSLIRYETLQELFAQNDIVTVHAGLNDVTRHSVTYKELALLKPGSIFINTSRGPVVVEEDLARILREKRIYAGIDVIHNERDWKNSPLAGCPNVIFTGHQVAISGEIGQQVMHKLVLENIRAFLQNKPLKFIVDPARYRLMT
jgi:phosphoglycerate dehydrogenase-like enzyme